MNMPVYRLRATWHGATFGVLLASLSACQQEPQVASAPLARVATYSSGAWTVADQVNPPFATTNSIFASGPDGRPLALRVFGAEVRLGKWDGLTWTSNVVATLERELTNEDQLYNGLMRISEQGQAFAIFSTSDQLVYVLAEQENGQFLLTPRLEAAYTCFDVMTTSDGKGRFLYSDAAAQTTYLATAQLDGTLVEELVYAQSSCGGIAESPEDGDIGAMLLMYNYEESSTMARLVERREGEEWRARDVVTSGVYSCPSCYIPQLEYRADGRAVGLIVDASEVAYAAHEQEDGTFKLTALTAPGYSWQMTALKRSSSGTVLSAYVSNATDLGIMTTGDSGVSLKLLEEGVGLMTPRLQLTPEGNFLSYFDQSGLQVIRPGQLEATLVDQGSGLGGYFGAFLSWGPDGSLQVFYNESHLESQ